MATIQSDMATMSDIPVGTVTFLFTDIEGSTQLLARLRDRYADLLAEHHHLLREVLARWHGREVDTQGDAFFVAFARAGDAINAVVDAQRALADHSWPDGVDVRVRMGLHTGEPWVVAEGYVGMDVHRAARIAHAGHGGQVLLSETTAALVLDDLPEGVTLLDLGCHQLRDMRRLEHIQQLVIDGLQADFPPLNSLASLPAALAQSPGGNGAREPRTVGPSPYRGLAAFREVDEAVFFGREAFTEQLAGAVHQQDLVAVIVGPSGSGKSSVVFAGLLPKLQREGDWLIVSLRPGGRPFHALAGALLPLLDDPLSETDRLIEIQKLSAAMASGELPLFQIVERALERHPDARRLLLLVDQFEELFTQRPDPDEQRQFLDELLTASQAGSARWTSPLVVLLTMRADFMGQALAHRPFADALQEGSLLLGPMNRAELQAVVEKPAELRGAAFEAGLVARILDDVGDEPGNLPLLEFALSLLWENMDAGWLTHDAYDAIGRVDGALARYAEEVYEALPSVQQVAAQRVFIQLVQPGEGTEDTRRVANRAELGDQNWPLVQHLADRRLIVTGRDEAGQETVEVVHEALIRSWQRLRGWIEADRAFRVWQEGLRAAMRQWQANDRDPGGLLRGAPLISAETWLTERGDELSPAERGFIDESAAFRASEQARRERRRRMIVGGLAGGLVIALILLAVAISQGIAASESAEQAAQSAATAEAERSKTEIEVVARSTAQANAEAESQARATAQAQTETERLRAEEEVLARATAQANAEAAELAALTQASIGLASQSIQELQGSVPERAVPLALEALENYPYTWQAERALGQAVFNNHLQHILSHEGSVNTAFWSPDGARIVTATDNSARIWDAKTGKELFALQPDSPMYGAGWSPDGNRVWINGFGFASLWDAMTGEYLFTLTGQEDWLSMLSWSPEGDRILTTGQDTTTRIWDAKTGEELAFFSGHDAPTSSCVSRCTPETSAWSPDGDRVVTIDEAGRAFVWDPTTGEEILQLVGHTAWVDSAVWSPDGQRIVTASDDDTTRIWDANTGEELLSYVGQGSEAYASWSPDGTRVLINLGLDGSAVVWDANTGEEIVNFREHSGKISWVEWSADGSQVMSGGQDGIVRIWDSTSGQILQEFPGHTQAINFVRWSPTFDQILSASTDGTVKVWDLEGELINVEIPEVGIGAWNLAWSPAGDRVAVPYLDGTLRIFDPATGEELAATQPEAGRNGVLVEEHFSPNGDELVVVPVGGLTLVYDAATGEKRLQIGQEAMWGFWSASWAPDGFEFATGTTTYGDQTNGVIQIWNAETGNERLAIVAHPATINWLAWSPDGQHIVSASEAGEAKIWDAANGELLFDLYPEGFTQAIDAPAWSPDGEQLAIYSGDGIITVWDPATGEPLHKITTSGVKLGRINWFPEQDRLLTSDRGGNVNVWDIPSGTEVASFTFPSNWVAQLSPNGSQVMVAPWPDGPVSIFSIWQSRDELIELAKECCVFRELTPEERQQFGLPAVAQED